ncbi:MAG: hypothetical protein WBW03_07550, partial [Silvibacterium sp.]
QWFLDTFLILKTQAWFWIAARDTGFLSPRPVARPRGFRTIRIILESLAKDKQLKADMKKLREAIKDGSCTESEWKPLSGYSSPRTQTEGAVSR